MKIIKIEGHKVFMRADYYARLKIIIINRHFNQSKKFVTIRRKILCE